MSKAFGDRRPAVLFLVVGQPLSPGSIHLGEYELHASLPRLVEALRRAKKRPDKKPQLRGMKSRLMRILKPVRVYEGQVIAWYNPETNEWGTQLVVAVS